jgi:predicted O-methyltransferase YrrM
MSERSTPVTEALFQYVAAHTAGEDAFLAGLRAAAAEAGLPRIWIAPEQASFMQIVLRAASVRDVLEVGTLGGYSAIWMARALPAGGHVRTIEVEPKHADFAERWIGRSDVADRIEIVRGAAIDVLPTLAAGSADAIFLDADRTSYPRYLPECLRILRPGGLLMVDNAFANGNIADEKFNEGSAPAMRAFLDTLAATSQLQGVIVPIGDGLWLGVRR